MNTFNTLVAIMATISLFLFGLKGFSKELQEMGAERLKNWLTKVTANRFSGFLLGAVLTAIIQSSSVVTSITVAMVDAGVIGFFNSLAVMVGANLGTSFTAWLVAFKLDNLGSWLLVAGTLISFIPHRINLAGKSIFYMGLILFSLQLINLALAPVGSSDEVVKWLARADFIPYGLLGGMVLTAMVQSSSVTTGLTIILASQGLLNLEGAMAIVIGSNLGTTSTALLASLSLSVAARQTALANLLFNVIGLLIFLPFIKGFTALISSIGLTLTYQIAMGHLLFNVALSLVALPFLRPLAQLVVILSRKKV